MSNFQHSDRVVVISGYMSQDFIVSLEGSMRIGRTTFITNRDNTDRHFGGCSVNVAYILAKLGHKARPFFRVGYDYEDCGLKAFLKDGGVCCEAIQEIGEERCSNTYIIEQSNGEHCTLFYPGAQDEKYRMRLHGDLFCDAGLALMTVAPYVDNSRFLEQVIGQGLPLAFGMKTDEHAFPIDFLKRIFAYASYVFMNETESEYICAKFGYAAIEQLFENQRLQYLIKTKGKLGSDCYFRNMLGNVECITVPAVRSECFVDASGSGDSYIAGFLDALMNGETVKNCCLWASTLASFVVEGAGCLGRVPDRHEILERFQLREYLDQ